MTRLGTLPVALGVLLVVLVSAGRLSGWSAAWHEWRAGRPPGEAEEGRTLARIRHLGVAVHGYPWSWRLRLHFEEALRRGLGTAGPERVVSVSGQETVPAVHLAWELRRSGADRKAAEVLPEVPQDLAVHSDPVLRKIVGLAVERDPAGLERVLREWELRSSRSSGARFRLGILLALDGAPEPALRFLRQDDTPPVGPAWVRFWRGFALVEAGRLDEADRTTERLVSRSPGFAPGWQVRGLALERQGRLDEAARAYGRALELNPAAERTRERLESLGER